MDKPRWFLALILLLSFAAIQAAGQTGNVGDKFEEKSGKGLEIITNPENVTVYIDGVERGVTPVVFETLASGEHQIRLVKEGYAERRLYVTLFNTSRLVASIEMEEERGLVLLSVYRAEGSPPRLPFNPQIFTSALDETINTVTLSADNRILLSLPTGYRTVSARAFGWEETPATVLVNAVSTTALDIYMKPAAFRLGNASQSRARFNPMNPGNLGAVEYRFEVSAPGNGAITITDGNGNEVYKKRLGNFNTWFQTVSWNGKDDLGMALPEGTYTVLIEATAVFGSAAERESASLTLETKIDHSLSIFPLSLESGISGLVFAPMPNVLSSGSFQIEAGILLGNFLLPERGAKDEGVFFTVPFKIGMRVSPVERLELATVFNVNPRLENNTGWGLSGSVKFNFFDAEDFPLSFAAAVSYAWAGKNGEALLSSGRGVGVYAPLSLEVSEFSFVFTPGIFWRGPEGLVPDLLLSAGALYKGSRFNAGVSARGEFDFTENASPRLLAGAQAYFFPPPSNFIFSFVGGIWTQDSLFGGYGGVSIGVIF